jgi:hypothetical protein
MKILATMAESLYLSAEMAASCGEENKWRPGNNIRQWQREAIGCASVEASSYQLTAISTITNSVSSNCISSNNIVTIG